MRSSPWHYSACFFTLDLSEALDKHVFYNCLLSVLLKVVVLWIYEFDISYTRLVTNGQSTILKICAFHGNYFQGLAFSVQATTYKYDASVSMCCQVLYINIADENDQSSNSN